MIYKCNKCGREYPAGVPYCVNPERGKCLDYTIQKIEYPATGGTFTYMVGMKYPFNGYPDHVTLGQNATVKRAVISTLKAILRVFKQHPIKNAIQWLSEVYVAEYAKYQIPEKKMCRSAREILRIGLKFAKTEHEKNAAWCIAMFWEMDSAYRYRGQDILNELSKWNLKKNSNKEIMRLLHIGIEREINITDKWKVLIWAMRFLLLFPSVKRTLKAMLLELNQGEIAPDISDKYFMARYFDYNFAGLEYEIREAWKKQEDEDYVLPVINAAEYANVDVKPNTYFYQLSIQDAEKMAERVKGRLIDAYKMKYEQIRNSNSVR